MVSRYRSSKTRNWPYQTSLVALLPTGDAHLSWWLTAPPIQFRARSRSDLSGCGKQTRMDPAVHCPCVTGVQRRHQRVRRGRDLARTASGHHASAISSAGRGRGAASSSQTYLCCYFPKPTFISVSFHILVLKACLGFLGGCLLRGGQMKSESHGLKEQEPVSAGWLTASEKRSNRSPLRPVRGAEIRYTYSIWAFPWCENRCLSWAS